MRGVVLKSVRTPKSAPKGSSAMGCGCSRGAGKGLRPWQRFCEFVEFFFVLFVRWDFWGPWPGARLA